VVLYSDGITDHLSPAGTEYGRSRLAQAVRTNSNQKADHLIAAIFKDLDKFSTTAFDDQTLFVMQVL
jgi:serine phosphatase RsbU (regulator of sigma subunit)